MFRQGHVSFIAGFATAAVLLGGLALAGSVVQKDISVTYNPLRYFFDGHEKFPPADQQGFVHNNRTYVPLRFMSESLGKDVQYDPATYSIYVGRRPSAVPEFWSHPLVSGEGTFRLSYFEKGTFDIRGLEYPNAVLLSSSVLNSGTTLNQGRTGSMEIGYSVPTGAKTMSGMLFIPDSYYGDLRSRQIGKLMIFNQSNTLLYSSDVLTTDGPNITFNVKIDGSTKLRFIVVLYPYHGLSTDEGMLIAEMGISNLTVE